MNRIKQLRTELKKTQKELASLLFVDQTAISNWECEKNLPDVDMLIKLAQIFNCPIDYILGLSNTTYENAPPQRAGLDLTEKEEQFILKLRGLDRPEQDMVEDVMDKLYKMHHGGEGKNVNRA